MSLLSKYAVPFNNRKSATNDNVVNRLVQGGIGYLKIELPVNPSLNNCIGFKIKVTSEDTKSLLFEGHISGSSSDGYNWIYASSSSNENSIVGGNPTLFCYKYIDPENSNKPGNIVKSVLLGSNDTNWGNLIRVSIEVLQATLVTAPDGEENKVKTEDVHEYSSVSTSIDESNPNSKLTDGWKFEVGNITDEIIAITDSKVTKDPLVSIILDGVVEGVAKRDEDGNIVITTSYTGNQINLYDQEKDSYGYVIADGSKLVNLSENEEIKNLALVSVGFDKPINITTKSDSDVNFNFTIQNSGQNIEIKPTISKYNLGEWSSTNNKILSIKTSNEVGKSSPVYSVPLETGGLGLIINGVNTDLYVGTGDGNKVVGGAKVCETKDEFDNLDKVDGKIVIYDSRLYVCYNGSYQEIKPSGKLSLDEIKNGYFYEKVNADAQLGGEIVRLWYGVKDDPTADRGFILSNDIHSHLINSSIHLNQELIDRWNSKLDSDDSYTKTDIDEKLDNLSSKDHYHGYHDSVNLIVEGDTDFSTHDYPYGHRILVKEHGDHLPYIRVAGEPNEWIELNEKFNIGDRVTANFGNFNEYVNINNVVTELTGSGISGDTVKVHVGYTEPSDEISNDMKDGDWYIVKEGY